MGKKKPTPDPDAGQPTTYRDIDPDAMMRELEVTDESEHDVVVNVVLSPGFVLRFRYSAAPALKRADLWDAACNAAKLFSLAQGVWFASANKVEGGMPYKLRWEAGFEVPT